MTQGRRLRRLALLLIAGITLSQTGCLWLAVGAGTAACCAGGYAYMKGEVPQTYVASFDDAWAATQKSLAELGMPVISADKKTSVSGSIRTRLGNGEVVTVQIDEEPRAFPTDKPLTRVGVRVAVLGDYPVSDRILNQVSTHLAARPGVTGVIPAGGAPPAPRPPATWTGVPSVTPPPPPKPPTTSTPPPPPANGTVITPTAAPPRPGPGLPAATPPPPLATATPLTPPPAGAGLPAATPPPPLARPEN